MNRLILSLTLVSAACLVSSVWADPPAEGKQRNRAEARQIQLEGRRGGPPRDPAKMVARIMQEFDKDGDEKLDKTELMAWAKAMQQRRGQLMSRRGKPGEAKAGKGGAKAKRRRAAEENAAPGGDEPVRPESE